MLNFAFFASAAFYIFGLAAQFSGITSPSLSVVLLVVATLLLLVSGFAWLTKKGVRLEPSQLITAGLIIAVLGLCIAGGGFLWQCAMNSPDPNRVPKGDPAKITDGPIQWLILQGPLSSRFDSNNNLYMLAICVMGRVVSDKETRLDDASLVSGTTGESIPLQINTLEDGFIPVVQARPIPPGAEFSLMYFFGEKEIGIPVNDFLKTWSKIYFVAHYNGKEFRQLIYDDAAAARSLATIRVPPPAPHVSKAGSTT